MGRRLIDIDAMLQDVDMRELVDALGIRRSKNDVLCPFHADRNFGSCKIEKRSGKTFLHCYVCRKMYNPIQLVKEVKKLSDTTDFPSVLEYIGNISTPGGADSYRYTESDEEYNVRIKQQQSVNVPDMEFLQMIGLDGTSQKHHGEHYFRGTENMFLCNMTYSYEEAKRLEEDAKYCIEKDIDKDGSPYYLIFSKTRDLGTVRYNSEAKKMRQKGFRTEYDSEKKNFKVYQIASRMSLKALAAEEPDVYAELIQSKKKEFSGLIDQIKQTSETVVSRSVYQWMQLVYELGQKNLSQL